MSDDAAATWSAALAALADGATRRYLRAGDWLFAEGDASTDVFLLEQGLVKIVKTAAGGGESLVTLRGAGGLVGEHSAVDGRPRGTGAIAATELVTSVVSRERLLATLGTTPGFATALLTQFTGQLRSTTRDVLALATGDALALVAARLSEMVADPMFESLRSTAGGAIVLEMPISQQELASWVGVSHRSTTAALRELRDRGLVSTQRLHIEVHDPDGLADIAGSG